MLFLWKTHPHGKVWIEGEALRKIASKKLPTGYFCQELSFVGEQDLVNLYITLPENENSQARALITQQMEALFLPMGMRFQIHWTRPAPREELQSAPIWKLPIFWSVVAGGVVALSQLGLKGIFWTAVGAGAGYGLGWLVLTKEGQELIGSVKRNLKR